jgi:hypothetical protein
MYGYSFSDVNNTLEVVVGEGMSTSGPRSVTVVLRC